MRFAGKVRNQTALTLGGGLVSLLAAGLAAGPAQAQNVFCPGGNLNGGGPTTLQSGACTNGATGAFSTAALSSQSLSEISQSTTQQSNTATQEAIGERRRTEAQRPAPAGGPRVAPSARPPARARTPAPATLTGPAPTAPAAPLVYKAEPVYKAPALIDIGPRAAVWTQSYGNYEHRTASFVAASSISGLNTPMNLSVDSKTDSWGTVAGLYFTFRNIHAGGDALIAGFLAGYMESNVTLNAAGISTDPKSLGNSISTTHIHLFGPTVGGFATYFSGPFSSDLSFKADFLSINEDFAELLGFNNGVGTVPFAGTASAHVTNLSTIGNLNYRIPVSRDLWVEPTVGFKHSYSLYDSAAAALGLSDGYVLRLQGGARFGTDFFWNRVHVTPTVTGLVYDDVKVVGGAIQNGAFIGGSFLPNDQGKGRGEGILAINFDYGTGLSSFVQGNVYGGQDLFGAGAKSGLRYQW